MCAAARHRTGKPTPNAYVESFNGKFRDECLNENAFDSLPEAREEIERWRNDYNRARPHRGLGQQTPEGFAGRSRPLSVLILLVPEYGAARFRSGGQREHSSATTSVRTAFRRATSDCGPVERAFDVDHACTRVRAVGAALKARYSTVSVHVVLML